METGIIISTLMFILISHSISALDYGQNGMPCSGLSDCQFPMTHCCGGPTNGKFCAQCCDDIDCAGRICIPGQNYQIDHIPGYDGFGPPHSRFCINKKSVAGGEKCFRNDMCQSGTCTKGLGWSGDTIHLPLGNCKF